MYYAVDSENEASLAWAVVDGPALQRDMDDADGNGGGRRLKDGPLTADELKSLNWNQTAGIGPPAVHNEVGPDGLPLPQLGQPPHG